MAQPDFASQLAAKNVIFRIPTPLFGLGLVQTTPDSVLRPTGCHGIAEVRDGNCGPVQYPGNDGTITRFGWKAQKSRW